MNKYEKAYNNMFKKIDVSKMNNDELVIFELVERATPKNVIKVTVGLTFHHCPSCNVRVESLFCPNCGQRLDWSE